jgi:hypothetical protein
VKPLAANERAERIVRRYLRDLSRKRRETLITAITNAIEAHGEFVESVYENPRTRRLPGNSGDN